MQTRSTKKSIETHVAINHLQQDKTKTVRLHAGEQKDAKLKCRKSKESDTGALAGEKTKATGIEAALPGAEAIDPDLPDAFETLLEDARRRSFKR